jgi:hypothetical protein
MTLKRICQFVEYEANQMLKVTNHGMLKIGCYIYDKWKGGYCIGQIVEIKQNGIFHIKTIKHSNYEHSPGLTYHVGDYSNTNIYIVNKTEINLLLM